MHGHVAQTEGYIMQWRTYREVYPKGGHSVVGDVRVWHALRSPQLDNQRDILVYLPPS